MRTLKTTIWASAGLLGLFALAAAPAAADQVINDDLIVDGSACIGFDCVNGESFGFDTIRIKENNLRIRAVDTSSTSSFPRNDWQITFNDSANGGAEKFSIDDIDSGRTPFTIEAGARSNALYVEADGDIGVGTNNPAVDVHIKTGNTPTLRLEQDGSSGFTPQTWDVAGNEANFFIRDATNGSTLPLRIQPGAASDSIFIEGGTSDVGLGTSSPSEDLHIKDTAAGAAKILIEDTTDEAGVGFTLRSGAAVDDWTFEVSGNGAFQINSINVAGGPEMTINEANGLVRVNNNFDVVGTLSKGAGSFKIDHPQDPENRYLSHSFVESPDMMNIYNGNVELDANGAATVEMPGYFETLNREFRYQLTSIGGAAPNLHVAAEIEGNRFEIAGGVPGMRVSWQVTGVRHDPYAAANRIAVETDKPEGERGTYLHAAAYGQPHTKSVQWARNPDTTEPATAAEAKLAANRQE